MWREDYVHQKLRELENDRALRSPNRPPSAKTSLLGPVAWRAGKALRRLGEGLEAWGCASPATETDVSC
jgi:hypothetical protein